MYGDRDGDPLNTASFNSRALIKSVIIGYTGSKVREYFSSGMKYRYAPNSEYTLNNGVRLITRQYGISRQNFRCTHQVGLAQARPNYTQYNILTFFWRSTPALCESRASTVAVKPALAAYMRGVRPS